MQVIIVGVALAVTGLLLLLRSLIFRRPARKSRVVHLMNPTDGENDRPASGSLEEWPSIIGAAQVAYSSGAELSEEDRIQPAVAQDRLLRMLR